MSSDNNQDDEPLLLQLRRDTQYLNDPDIPQRLLTVDEEAAYIRRYMASIRDITHWSKSEAITAEIEFCVQNNLVRHLCAIAAHFYAQHEYSVRWRPVGFFKGGGSYREIKLEFDKYDVDTKTSRTYEGTLTREWERGERYTLCVNGGNEEEYRRANGIVDILNILGVPRAYIDGLFDMLDYGMEATDNEYAHKRKELAQIRERLIDLEHQVRERSQQLQSLKRPDKWRRKRYPIIKPSDAAAMPAVPASIEPLLEAVTKYQQCSGIYFLWDLNRTCAYVGKSRNVGSRLSSHNKAVKEHAVSVLPLPVAEIHYAELYYIWLLRPYLNREGAETAKAITPNTAPAT
jgi:hypothetical protein